jgi:uncharacterized protein (DUF779 family)
MSIQQIREAARKSLHDHLSVPAVYSAVDGSTVYCTMRLTVTNISDIGDLGGLSGIGNAGFASTIERGYKGTFLVSELIPFRGGMVELEDGTRYRITQVHPPYNITIDADLEYIG